MDVWIVAVAAGAGYVAQHWKDLRRGGQIISESSPGRSNIVKPDSSRQPLDKKCLFRRLVKIQKFEEDVSEEKEEVSDVPTAEVASTSEFDGERLVTLVNFEHSNAFSTSSSLPGLIGSDDLQGDQEGVKVGERVGDLLLERTSAEIGPSYGSAKNRSMLRSRRSNGRFIRPLSSLESCLTAHLYKEHVDMEEYMFSSIPSPSMQTVRPFFVTDGSNVISRAIGDSFIVRNRTAEDKPHKETNSEYNETVFGVPPQPNIGSLEIRRKTKVKTGREWGGRLCGSCRRASRKHSNLVRGSSHGILLICLGISFGIISSFLANRREVDKLNELLKQTANLVQDLQEELEMKDSLTVKELAVEDYESQNVHVDSFNDGAPKSFSHEQNLGESKKDDNKEFHNQEEEDKFLSKIEAELEAELEMLELNMNSSRLEGKLSNLVELDPDSVPDIAQGELRADMFGRQAGDQPYADLDGSGSSTTHSANYAVSPRELSLRLHEVLQSRLEERIKELETEIANSQRKVQYMEPEHLKPWRDFSSSEAGGSSSIQGTPNGKEQDLADEPVVLNLSGEALDAYNEAYDEFTKMNESEEEDLPSEVGNNNFQKRLDQFDQNVYWIRNGGENHYMAMHPVNKGTSIYRRGEDNNITQDDVGTSGDENEHGDDEMERLLIKHIVEKTRKGSPVVLNAQRALFSMEDNAF